MVTRRAFTAFSILAALPQLFAQPALAEPVPGEIDPSARKLIDAARAQIGVTTLYDPAYLRLAYPGGDVPTDRGVCTDVIIRAYRNAFGFDLQKAVHEDMRRAFAAYPKRWGLNRPDRNIDHRRVLNLMVFFGRRGAAVARADASVLWQPGDIVTQMLPGNLPHMGIVSDRTDEESGRLLVIHNIGAGTREEDILTRFEITGQFRFAPRHFG